MSEAEFWWVNLTNDQRRFVVDSCGDSDLTWGELAPHAFERAASFHTMPGWPETPMRVV